MRVFARALSVISIAGAIVLFASPASAALFLVFETDARTAPHSTVPNTLGLGSPGDVVIAGTGGESALPDGIIRMPVFLAPRRSRSELPARAPSARQVAARPGVVSLGDVIVDSGGNGRLRFTVPDVGSGPYQIVAFSPPCADSSAGRNLLPIAGFRVRGSSRLPVTGASTGTWAIFLGLLGVSLPAIGTLLRVRNGHVTRDVMPTSRAARPRSRLLVAEPLLR